MARIPKTALVVTAVLFFWITGNGILSAGMMSDDWRQLGGPFPQWGAMEGRWAMNLLYDHILDQRFVEPLQILLAYGCFFYVALTLARRAADERHVEVAAIVIFLLGVNHTYMLDALNFSAHILAYPLALALSLAAFDGLDREPMTLRQAALRCLLGGFLLSWSIGLYQSFGVFGLLATAVALIRVDRLSDRQAVGLVLRAAVVLALGAVLYLAQSKLYLSAVHAVPVPPRFEPATLQSIVAKLVALPDFTRRVYNGWIHYRDLSGLYYPALFVGLAAVACAAAARLISKEGPATQRVLGGGRILLGAVGALFVPVLFWFGYTEMFAPGRALAFVGFVPPTLAAAGAALLLARFKPRGDLIVRYGVYAPLAVAAAAGLVAASAIWNDQKRVVEHDTALASSIYARLSTLPGFDGKRFTLVGRSTNPELLWGGSLGDSVLSFPGGEPAIFNKLFGYAGKATFIGRSPQPCHAYPAGDSAYVLDRSAYVCLQDDAGILPLVHCASIGRGGVDGACLKAPGELILTSAHCALQLRSYFVRNRAGGREILTRETINAMTPQYRDARSGVCYAVFDFKGQGSSQLSLGEYAPGDRLAWEQRLVPSS